MTDLTPPQLLDPRLRLAHRQQELAELYRTGQLADTVPLAGDEEVLDQMGHSRDSAFLYTQAWLVREHIAARGCYADPAAREASRLYWVITTHAGRRYACPDTCPGTAEDCDGCDTCADGNHQHKALMSMAMANTLLLLDAL